MDAGIVNALRVLHELTRQQKLIDQEGTILAEISQTHSAILVKRAMLGK